MISRSIAAAGLLLAITASTAAADFRDFGIQCTTGALRACVSVQVWTSYNASTGLHDLNIRISNPQGTPGFEGYPRGGLTWLDINNVGYTDPGYGMDWDDGVPEGTVSECRYGSGCRLLGTGDRAGDQDNDGSWRRTGPNRAEIQVRPAHAGWAITGCDDGGYDNYLSAPTTGGGVSRTYSTCGGAITYTTRFQGGGEFFLTDEMSLSFQSSVFDGGEWHWVGCGFGEEIPGMGADCETVVPEPITVVLLGTGLAGIGAAYRRRKKDELA